MRPPKPCKIHGPITGPLRVIVLCDCGWRHEEPKRSNALGRASRMRGAINRHFKEKSK